MEMESSLTIIHHLALVAGVFGCIHVQGAFMYHKHSAMQIGNTVFHSLTDQHLSCFYCLAFMSGAHKNHMC